MKEKYLINARIIDPKNNLDEVGGLIIDSKGLIKAVGKQVANGNISGSYGLRAHTHGNTNYYSHYAYTGSTNIEAAVSEQTKLMQSKSFKMFSKSAKREIKKTTMMVVMATYNYPNS